MRGWFRELWGAADSGAGRTGVLGAGGLRPEGVIQEERDYALFRRFFRFARPELRWLLLALGLMPVLSALGLLQPWLIKQAVDAALAEEGLPRLMQVVIWMALVIGGEFVVRFAQTFALQFAGQRAVARLREALFAHLQRLHLRFFDGTPLGRLVTRLTSDVDNLGELFASGAVTALADMLTVVFVVVFMLLIDWELALVTFIALPPLALFVRWLRARARAAFRDIRTRVATLNAHLAEQVGGLRIMRSLAVTPAFAEEYGDINAALRNAHMRSVRYDALLYSVVDSMATASIAIVLAYAAARLMGVEGALAAASIGTVVAFYEYIQRFFIPVRDLATKYTVLQSALASAERLQGLLDETDLDPGQTSTEEATAVADAPPALRFEGVDFSYTEAQATLREVSFSVAPGQRVALVGATGSGKSTLISLLLRFYDTQSGRIWLGDQSLDSLSPRAARRHFAYVPQDPYLVRGTLAENIALGTPVSPDKVVAHARALDVDEAFITELGGPERFIEEGGANLSAGQKQLVALLRALCADRPVVLLDEATAQLDSETEARLQAATERVLRGRSALVIAHRLSTIQAADHIVVLHKGRISEQGCHAELLANGGIYAHLHRLHFSATAEA